MKKILLTIILSIVTLSCTIFMLSSCSLFEDDIASPEDVYSGVYISDYNGESDSDIILDGKFDDDAWAGKEWYSNTFTNNFDGNMPIIYVSAFTTRYGVYMGTFLQDSNLVYNGEFAFYKNSLLEYLWVVYDVDDERELNEAYDYNWLNRRMFFMDLGGDGYGTGERMKKGIYVDGELNSGDTNSAGIELFIPWSELGIEVTQDYNGEWVYPKNVYICPNYRAVLPGNTGSTLMSLIQNPIQHMTDMWVFNENGYTDADKEGAVVGDSINGISKNGTWDLENEANGEISVTTGLEWSTIYFRDAYATNFVVETTMIPIGRLSNRSGYGGVFSGFYMLNTENVYYSSMLSFGTLINGINGTKTVADATLVTLTNANQTWEQTTKQSIVNSRQTTQEGVKFKMIKDGGTVHYFVNDEYLASETIESMAGDVFVGFYTLNNKVIYRDYSYTSLTDTKVKDVLSDSNIRNITASVNTRGGSVKVNESAVYSGSDASITITCQSEYTIKSVLANGEDITEDVMKNSLDGTYTLKNVEEDINIEVSFEKMENPPILSGYVMSNGSRSSGNITLISLTSPAIRYSINASVSGYHISVLPGTYYVYCENSSYTGAINSLNLEENVEQNIYIYNGNNFYYDSGDKTVHSISSSRVDNVSYIYLNEDVGMINSADGSFMVSYEASAYECSWPCVGFSIIDSSGHSVEFYIGDTGTTRLLFGQTWKNVAPNISVSTSGFVVNPDDNLEKNVKVTLIYQAEIKTFYFYANDKLVYSTTIDALNEHIRNNTSSDSYKVGDYLSDSGSFKIALAAYQVEPVSNRTSDNSLLTFSKFESTVVQETIDQCLK